LRRGSTSGNMTSSKSQAKKKNLRVSH